jgi:uncharacterized protein YggE
MRYTALVSLALLPTLASAQGARVEDDGIPRVSATATRTARLAPDRATVFAVVEGSAESAPEAAQRAERKLQAVTDAVKQLGARVEVLGTVPYGVMPAPNYGGFPGQTAPNPFVARYIMRIQPARVDQLMNVSSTLMAAGVSVLTPPSFEAAAADSARRAKFSEALAQARADAEALAAGLGMRLGALIEVTGNAGPSQQFGQQFIGFGRGYDMSGPGQPPEVTVTASVTVRYRLQQR